MMRMTVVRKRQRYNLLICLEILFFYHSVLAPIVTKFEISLDSAILFEPLICISIQWFC
jgi:hypothetical protein